MSISQDQVVSIHYTLRDEAGEIIDSSPAGEPLAYLHGHGNLVPGLERELAGRSAGDKLTVTLSPADGYGEHDPKLVQRVPRRALKGVGNLRVGMRLSASSEIGRASCRERVEISVGGVPVEKKAETRQAQAERRGSSD